MLSAFLGFVPAIMAIVNKLIPDPIERAKIQAQLEASAAEAGARFAEAQSRVIVAEAEGSWLQRSWRPILMFLLMGVIVWHALFVPFIAVLLAVDATSLVGLLLIPGPVWTLLTVGLGGYVGARTLEKVMNTVYKEDK
jgi:hypothetical protein